MSKTRLVYLLAASHSGSTLLAMLLGSHPEVCAVGELKLGALGDLSRYRCSCGAPIRHCPFWEKVRRDMTARGHTFQMEHPGTDYLAAGGSYVRRLHRPLHRGRWGELLRDAALGLSPSWAAILAAAQARNAALVQTLSAVTRKSVVVDSSKVALRLKYLLRNPDLEVRVVRLVRDGRGVALTYMDPARFADAGDPALRGGGMGADREGERLHLATAAREWRRSNEEAEAVLASVDRSRWVEVRYEELCRDPERVLGAILEFVGVDPVARPQDFRSAEHHVIGNGMRLDATSEIRLDERWRSALSAGELREFDRVAGDLNRTLGYA
jgi:hypothetical protein